MKTADRMKNVHPRFFLLTLAALAHPPKEKSGSNKENSGEPARSGSDLETPSAGRGGSNIMNECTF